MIENVFINIETSQSISALPYPDCSKILNIKQLSTKEIFEWSCSFQLKNYQDTQNSRLRIQIPPNESCP